MAIGGIGGLGPGILPAAREPATDASRTGDAAAFQTDFESLERSPDQGPFDAGAVPLRPPPGADPEAWALLTDEERAFFESPGLGGPVTYARSAIEAALAALGSQLDVRG